MFADLPPLTHICHEVIELLHVISYILMRWFESISHRSDYKNDSAIYRFIIHRPITIFNRFFMWVELHSNLTTAIANCIQKPRVRFLYDLQMNSIQTGALRNNSIQI